jgi:trimethylamine--corrinoid protein Co-methyltransferase
MRALRKDMQRTRNSRLSRNRAGAQEELVHDSFNSRPRISVLNSEARERIHFATLRILAEVGLRVDAPAARDTLRRAGARFSDDAHCTLPAPTVARALEIASGPFPVFDRTGRTAFSCGSDPARLGIGVTNLYYEDPASGEISPFTRAHMGSSVRLGHALGQYDLISTVGVLHDTAPAQADLLATLEMAANTTKPLVLLISDPDQFVPCLDLLETLTGDLSDQPFVLPYVNPITPLVLNAETTGKMTAAIERGLPLIFSNYGMAGATTAITPFRALALLNAELLAGLVFAHAVRPGTPVVLGSLPAYFDMRTMVDFYDPRSMLINAACAEMMAHYGIPHAGTSGSGNGWGPDILAAGDLWLNHLVSVIGCAGLVPFVGGNLGSKVFSPALVVYGAEVIEKARSFAAGFDLEDAEEALAEIVAVGPGGGFLDSPHTLRHLRRAYYDSRIFPHYGLEGWQAAGRPDPQARLRQAAVDAVKSSYPPNDRERITAMGEGWIRKWAN